MLMLFNAEIIAGYFAALCKTRLDVSGGDGVRGDARAPPYAKATGGRPDRRVTFSERNSRCGAFRRPGTVALPQYDTPSGGRSSPLR